MVQEQVEEEVGRLKLEKEAAEEPERLAKEEHEKVCAYIHTSLLITPVISSHQYASYPAHNTPLTPRHTIMCVV